MDKSKEEKKSALKLVNKYAESYSILENENKQLKNEIQDLRLNLKINKEIIEGLYNLKSPADKETLYHKKVRQESNVKDDQINKLRTEIDDLRYRLNYQEQCNAEKIDFFHDENEKLKNKLFFIDNVIVKKDNIITTLKKKVESFNENDVLLADPSKILMQINDELLMYKEIYSKLMNSLNHNRVSLARYERIIHDLQLENTKLTSELNIHNRLKIEEMREMEAPKTTVRMSHNNIESVTNRSDNIPAYNIDDILRKINGNTGNSGNSQRVIKQYYEYDEWWSDALRINGLTQQDFNKFKSMKQYTRIVDLIEFLNSIIVDKNFQIKILDQEIKNLHETNSLLNTEITKIGKRGKKFDESLDGNISSNSIVVLKKPIGSFEIKKLNTMSSITSSEFRDGLNGNRIFTINDNNESGSCIEGIDININDENMVNTLRKL
jgi:hypothetical protein